MMFIEIKEDKFEKIAEYTEKMLKYGGKIMSCLSEVGEEYGMSFREGGSYENRNHGGYNRSMMGTRMRQGELGYRDEDEWEDEEISERRGMRRRRDSMGGYR